MYKIEADATDSSPWCYFSQWINFKCYKTANSLAIYCLWS